MSPGELLHTLLSKHGAARYCSEWTELRDHARADLEEAAAAVFGAEREHAATIAYEIGEEFDEGSGERNVARVISASIRLVRGDGTAPPPTTITEARANIEKAVLAEREACALIAANYHEPPDEADAIDPPAFIARCIRARK